MGQCNWCSLQRLKKLHGTRNISLEQEDDWIKVRFKGDTNDTGKVWFAALTGQCCCGEQQFSEKFHFHVRRWNGKHAIEFDFQTRQDLPTNRYSVQHAISILRGKVRKPFNWNGARFALTCQTDGHTIFGTILVDPSTGNLNCA